MSEYKPPNDPEQAALLFARSYFELLGLSSSASSAEVLERVEEYRFYISKNWRTAGLRSLSATYNDVYLKKIRATFTDPAEERAYRKSKRLDSGSGDGEQSGKSPIPRVFTVITAIVALLFAIGRIGGNVRATSQSPDTHAASQAKVAHVVARETTQAARQVAYEGSARVVSNANLSADNIDSEAAVNFVRDYYDLWNKGDYQTMYGMLSSSMKAKNPYDAYVKYHHMVQHIDVNATPTSIGSIVDVRITSRDLETDGSITQSVNVGQWFLSKEDKRLRLNSQNVHGIDTEPVSTAQPAEPAQVNADDNAATEFVRAYYRLWNQRDFQSMYAMLSPAMQQKNPYPDYARYHSMVQSIDVDAEPGSAENVVNVRITSRDLETDGSVTQSVNVGQWYLRGSGNELMLDSENVHSE